MHVVPTASATVESKSKPVHDGAVGYIYPATEVSGEQEVTVILSTEDTNTQAHTAPTPHTLTFESPSVTRKLVSPQYKPLQRDTES
jgi:hypothetical protein